MTPHPLQTAPQLIDNFDRRFSYLRLSVTDVCNFRCQYCLPNGYTKPDDKPDFLSLTEITHLVNGFAALGIRKVRLTGGEPSVRHDLVNIIQNIAAIDGIETIALTTNGYSLAKHAQAWRDAGVSQLNVSLDSLDRATFEQARGVDKLDEVMSGLKIAQAVGFKSIKINAVLLKGINDGELPRFMDWLRTTPVTLRFIELMQTGHHADYFKKHHISADTIRQQLIESGWHIKPRGITDGPAVEYTHPDFVGKIGLIAPYAKDFCDSCNRLRVSARGELKLCLFGDGDAASDNMLRTLLQNVGQSAALQQQIIHALTHKPATHLLHQGITGKTFYLASIGG